MAKEAFIEKNFRPDTLDIINKANTILAEYAAQGFTMTLRQLHYQFVARDLYANTPKNYKRLGSIMSDARLAGATNWDYMEDRVRSLSSLPVWSSPSSILDAVANQYREDIWSGQDYRPEVWIEKDALVGVIERICHEFRVPYFACRGYVSQSAQYEASKRFIRTRQQGQRPIVFHLGDHDPSGLDMTRENKAKFALLTGAGVEVRRLALNYDQVQEYNPPPNFAKESDSRAPDYIQQFGNESWELDALDPPVIEALIREALESIIDPDTMDEKRNAEDRAKSILEKVSGNWSEVAAFAENL